jgi:CRP-like cAMP-binding protein
MSETSRVRLPRGATLFVRGDPATCLYILQEGAVDIVDELSHKVLRHLKPGDFFGEQAILVGGIRSATAIATADSLCMCMDTTAEGISTLLRDESALSRIVFQALLLQLYLHQALR